MNKLDLEKIRKFHNFSVSMIIVFLFIVFWGLGILTAINGDVGLSVINIIVFSIFIFACVMLPMYLLVVISNHWWIKR